MSETGWGTCSATVTPHQVRVAAVVMAHKKQVQVSVLSRIPIYSADECGNYWGTSSPPLVLQHLHFVLLRLFLMKS